MKIIRSIATCGLYTNYVDAADTSVGSSVTVAYVNSTRITMTLTPAVSLTEASYQVTRPHTFTLIIRGLRL